MTELPKIGRHKEVDRLLVIEEMSAEVLSDLRHLMGQAFMTGSQRVLSKEEIDRTLAWIRGPDVGNELFDAIRQKQIFAGSINGTLVAATCWSGSDGGQSTARLRWTSVSPMFADCGIGRRLVSHAELAVARAGYEVLSVRTLPTISSFYEHLGYVETARGVQQIAPDVTLQVVYLKKRLVHSGVNHLTRH